jgi:hypothetical protein
MHSCRDALLSQCVRVRAYRNPRRVPVSSRRDGVALVLSRPTCHPATKIDQCAQKARARHAHKKYFVLDTLLTGLTKSARMHKHANETRAGAGHSDDACSQPHAPTHAAALERAFPAPQHAFPAPQRRRRQHTQLENFFCTDMYAHGSANVSVCTEGEKCCQELVRRYANTCQFRCI